MKLEAVIGLEKEIKYYRREKDSGETKAEIDTSLFTRDLPILVSLACAYYTGYLLSELYMTYSF
ncbi:MAG: hypothetical protein AABW58_02500 [Nanoarchaeota archaeon]